MARSRDQAVKTAEQAESGDLGPEPHAAVATPLSPQEGVEVHQEALWNPSALPVCRTMRTPQRGRLQGARSWQTQLANSTSTEPGGGSPGTTPK